MSLQTPPTPAPSRRPPISRRAALGIAAALAATTAAAALMASALDGPDREPARGAAAAASPSAAGTAVTAPATPAGRLAPVPGTPPGTLPHRPSDTPPGTPRAPAPDDVDGDGRSDALSVQAPGTLQIRYADGRTDTVTFDAAAEPRLLGTADADGDGRAEVFVHVGSAASNDQTSLFRYTGGELRLVTLDGRQMWLVAGASVRHAESWACRPRLAPTAAIVQWQGQSDDGVSYRGTLDTYRFSGATLVHLGSRPLTVDEHRQPPRGCGTLTS